MWVLLRLGAQESKTSSGSVLMKEGGSTGNFPFCNLLQLLRRAYENSADVVSRLMHTPPRSSSDWASALEMRARPVPSAHLPFWERLQ